MPELNTEEPSIHEDVDSGSKEDPEASGDGTNNATWDPTAEDKPEIPSHSEGGLDKLAEASPSEGGLDRPEGSIVRSGHPAIVVSRRGTATTLRTPTARPRAASLMLSRATSARSPVASATTIVTNRKLKVAPQSTAITQAPPVEKEFSFTDYDIEKDVLPQTPIASNDEMERKQYRQIYKNICRRVGVIPVSSFEHKFMKKNLDLRKRGLGPKGARALAVALVDNMRVTSLDLTDNDVGAEGALCIAEMLTANDNIVELNISDNNLGSKGGFAVCNAIVDKDFKSLNLSGNKLAGPDAYFLAQTIENTISLREVYLAHNGLDSEGAVSLGRALVANDTVQVLDLSWNHIRGQGAIAIAYAVKENTTLKVLNVSWNGFSTDGCAVMGEALIKNTSLEELDMRCNRVYPEGLTALLKGIKLNHTLSTIKLGMNPITPNSATHLLKTLKDTNIRKLDLQDVVVTPEFEEVYNSIMLKRDFCVKYGVMIHHSHSPVRSTQQGISSQDPRAYIFKVMQKEGMRVIDLFFKLDEDGSHTVSRDEFKNAILKKSEIPITEGQLDDLIDLMDKNCDGEIDIGELLRAERDYHRIQTKRKKAAEALRVQEQAKQRELWERRPKSAMKAFPTIMSPVSLMKAATETTDTQSSS